MEKCLFGKWVAFDLDNLSTCNSWFWGITKYGMGLTTLFYTQYSLVDPIFGTFITFDSELRLKLKYVI